MSYNSPISSTSNYGVVKVGTGINVTAGVISVVPNGILNTVLVTNTESPYSVLSTDNYIGVIGTGVLVTINLPIGVDGRELVIKSEFSNTSDVQITPSVGEFLEGAGGGILLPYFTSYYPSVTLVFRAGQWNIV